MSLSVEVAYANTENSWLIPVVVAEDSTVFQTILSSGILEKCAEIDLRVNKVGIFSKIVSPATPVRTGDRVEIYRPLLLDPKQARRLRAEKNKRKKTG